MGMTLIGLGAFNTIYTVIAVIAGFEESHEMQINGVDYTWTYTTTTFTISEYMQLIIGAILAYMGYYAVVSGKEIQSAMALYQPDHPESKFGGVPLRTIKFIWVIRIFTAMMVVYTFIEAIMLQSSVREIISKVIVDNWRTIDRFTPYS
jgi:hypothetical protein